MYYNILNNQTKIDGLEEELLYSEFKIQSSAMKKNSLVFEIFCCEQLIQSCYGIGYLTNIYKGMQGIFFSKSNRDVVMLLKDDKWSYFNIYADKEHKEAVLELMLVGFYSWISLRQSMLVHSSAIEYQGKSLVFTAPSGTGKTTQAELWMKYRGAKILNGDKVFLKQEANAIHAWGSPWTGSSPYGLNSSAPLEAIIILKQAKENSIRRLDTLEAMAEFIPNVFFPRWDERCEQGVLDFLDKVMSETKFYLLSCRPDEEAVEITEKAIFGDGLRKEG